MRSLSAVFLSSIFLLAVSSAQAGDNKGLIETIQAGARASGSDRLIIVEKGQTLVDESFGKVEKMQSVMSVTKSVCSLSIGILMDRGAIKSIEQPASDWIPSWKDDAVRSKITLRMLMTHTSGLPDDNAIADAEDRIEFASKVALVAAPGEKFLYSGVGSALLQTVIAQASGQTLTQFVDEALLLPLGITSREWLMDKTGHEKTGGGLSLVPSDLLKIGEMMLARGVYHGKRIVSVKSYQRMITKSQTLEDYGLMWWLKNPQANKGAKTFKVFMAVGWGGQFIIVYPEKDLIVVRTRDPKKIEEGKMSEQEYGDLAPLVAEWK